MMSTKHTPGPWFHCHTGEPSYQVDTGDAGGYTVAECIDNGDDARLIAAAPDLLESLEALTVFRPYLEKHMDKADKLAWAKARAALEDDAARPDLQPTFRKSARELADKMKTTPFFLNNEGRPAKGRRTRR